MAKSDVLIKMKADVSNYDANIAKARKQLEGFKKDNLSVGGVMKQVSGSMAPDLHRPSICWLQRCSRRTRAQPRKE